MSQPLSNDVATIAFPHALPLPPPPPSPSLAFRSSSKFSLLYNRAAIPLSTQGAVGCKQMLSIVGSPAAASSSSSSSSSSGNDDLTDLACARAVGKHNNGGEFDDLLDLDQIISISDDNSDSDDDDLLLEQDQQKRNHGQNDHNQEASRFEDHKSGLSNVAGSHRMRVQTDQHNRFDYRTIRLTLKTVSEWSCLRRNNSFFHYHDHNDDELDRHSDDRGSQSSKPTHIRIKTQGIVERLVRNSTTIVSTFAAWQFVELWFRSETAAAEGGAGGGTTHPCPCRFDAYADAYPTIVFL